ncbi:MAG: ABC-F family ATP-binding cassette domain-containing protein [Clostridiales bacterium]|nr:ABC-F family ATP-binding cassette domain-containing protein [Clostridiales bacterium]MCF8021730.1 ABC-F family ATP-binding cassette domain-containing protein [Clostridiales bacterium]
MILLQASHICKSFAAKPILDNINLTIQENERTGLIGANGAGKSTLLKIINGDIEPESGKIYKSKEVTTGYLSQEAGIESRHTVWEELLKVFRPLIEQEKELRKLEKQMGNPAVLNDPQKYNQVSQKYAALEDQFRSAGGYSYQANIYGVLHGLKFIEDDYNREISTLSGGQKTRLALARLLMLRPDILILDEPTNYLDMESMAWLENYLQSYTGSVLVVSHDRYFLDNLTSEILELENNILRRYNGNYTKFLDLKAQWIEQQQREYEKYKAEKEQMEEFVQRNIARDSTSGRAKAKRKQLQKMEVVHPPENIKKNVGISFGIQRSSGKEVLNLEELAVGYNNKPVSENISFEIYRGDRVALLGPNGTGKTTLLKTITGELHAVKGNITQGFHVSIGYHHQEQEYLSEHKTVLDELWDHFPHMDEKDVRTVLGSFLFTGDDVYKKISNISGGERARLELAELMCKKTNFLIMDEPTNHLDVYSREALENSLLQYPGTLLFVSHDRYFLHKIATRVIELTNAGIRNYPGGYTYYLEKKQAETDTDKTIKKEKDEEKPGKGKLDYLRTKEKQRQERKRQRRLQELEEEIPGLEEHINTLEMELYEPEVYNDHQKYIKKSSELEKLHNQLEEHLEEWVNLEE